jgi:hypothetical protein
VAGGQMKDTFYEGMRKVNAITFSMDSLSVTSKRNNQYKTAPCLLPQKFISRPISLSLIHQNISFSSIAIILNAKQ